MLGTILCVFVVSLFVSVSVDAFGPSPPLSTAPRLEPVQIVVLHAAKREKSEKGFGKQVSVKKQAQNSGKSIYSLPALYDLAFGYRSFEDEVEFLLHAHEQHSSAGEPPRHVLELAAGPSRHSLTALSLQDSPVQSVTAVDLSPEMKEYASQLADDELRTERRDCFQYICGDMRKSLSESSQQFDSAWILLGSLQHLHTNIRIIPTLS